jgi:HEAT repeat protein
VRVFFSARLVGMSLALGAVVAAQEPATSGGFSAADTKHKTTVLVQIIRHESVLSPATLTEILQIGLVADDVLVREAALAAVQSRAAGPRVVNTAAVTADWTNDHEHIQRLRPHIMQIVRDDPADDVRVEAIAALISLDFTLGTDLVIASSTQELLIDRFYHDSSARVRAKVAAGFGTDPQIDSVTVRDLLASAFSDPDYRVRHAAISGVGKFDRDTALKLLLNLLQDPARPVRAQAASKLSQFHPSGSDLAPIEQARRSEKDGQIRQLLDGLLAVARRQ